MSSNSTLAEWLEYQSEKNANSIAFRHKRLGIWQQTSWKDAYHQVLRLVNVLEAEDFGVGDTLYLLSDPRPEALLLSLAAQWLGGISAPLDPGYQEPEVIELLRHVQPSFIFTEGESQVSLLIKADLNPSLILYAEPKGLSKFNLKKLVNINSSIVFENKNPVQKPPNIHKISAFHFYRINNENKVEFKALYHHDIISEGMRFIKKEHISDKEEALAARSFAISGHIRYLLAPWLLSGFTLNFPENINTRDNDRRELGPSFVAGTSETYQRLFNILQKRLPDTGSLRRSFIDWSLRQQGSSSFINRLIARSLILNPLKDVIGFSRIKVALVVGTPLSDDIEVFFRNLGIQVKNYEDILNWNLYVKETHAFTNNPSQSTLEIVT